MITACMIAFNEEDHIEYSIRNILDCSEYINQIIIIEGVIDVLKEYATPEGGSTDRTMEVISETIEKYGKKNVEIIIKKGLWKNKTVMRNEYLKYVKNDYILVWDADEFYMVDDIKYMHELTQKQNIDCIMYPFTHFFHDMQHQAVGGGWNKTQLRFSRYKKGWTYAKHYTLSDEKGETMQWSDCYKKTKFISANHVNSEYHRSKISPDITILDRDIWIYHLGYVKNKDMVAMKLALYAKRDGKKKGTIKELAEAAKQNSGVFDKRIEKGINPDPKGIAIYTGEYPEALKRHKWFNKKTIRYEGIEEYENSKK